MGPPIFYLSQVTRQFQGLTALAEVNLSIAAGERVALIGPSGAGKSTLLSLLNGTLLPSAGQVTVLGQDLRRLSPRQRRRVQRQIGTVYQQHHLVTNLSVIHNVNAGHLGRWSLAKAAWSLLWPQSVEIAARALAQVGIAEKLYVRTDRLSGGEQQRVAIARVLVQDPVAILADEPIASLDPARAHDLMALLCRLTEQSGKTLVISLHDIEYAFQYCTRLVGLRQGQIQFDAPPAQVTDAMIHELYRLEQPVL
ncbi:ATP-binding cassette domain-containing protein [Thermoleptolyngbya sichuanensis A183]|uniref:ATP-binding cassette domain-containing protein n=1 Tax=Thermoleptolyngbya sichuanensis A183 TaxID=2737172 RepID=A0A6M8B7F3_9CYAN|nr:MULTISPECIES: ATP-binding cassette domain-containing protein [Thermoleptolyngbya]MDG2616902.1 ATP-binding cassette domain-containing protein [Thermoleptolyngbya sichuanensis XZ-Cy5]QKD83289.1 ATP-binding cassette domain-containing protein [Thermoleptolyngbya sichuanensis A183]HIK41846.1 ATP-binding cassette domain-containing protein [Thermoleptolyngbya sp. M55_K2018_002]